MRFLIALLALSCVGAYGQAVYTPPTPATAAVPGKMVAPAGSGSTGTACTFTGNAVPATAVIVNCTLGAQVLISSVTVPISSASSIAVTLQINSGAGLATANTVMISYPRTALLLNSNESLVSDACVYSSREEREPSADRKNYLYRKVFIGVALIASFYVFWNLQFGVERRRWWWFVGAFVVLVVSFLLIMYSTENLLDSEQRSVDQAQLSEIAFIQHQGPPRRITFPHPQILKHLTGEMVLC